MSSENRVAVYSFFRAKADTIMYNAAIPLIPSMMWAYSPERVMRRHATLFLLASALGGSTASAQCLTDADGDGHPLFFSTHARADLMYFDGEVKGGRATDVAFGDLDADGDLDGVFAVADVGAKDILENSYVSILRNRGDAVFDHPVIHDAGAEVCAVALGDFDDDGDLDIAAANAQDDSVSIYLNDGTGTFSDQTVVEVGDEPRSLLSRDFNQDGLDDLAVLNSGSSSVSILLATGGGAFAPGVSVPVEFVTPKGLPNVTFPYPGPFMDAGDVNGDGAVDLAVPCRVAVKILLGDGNGGFSVSPEVADIVNSDAYDVVLADLNADGRLDVACAVTNVPATAISVVLQNEDGSWAPPMTLSGDVLDCPGCFYFHNSLDAGDLDNDGDLDLVLGNENREFAVIYRNEGDGTFGDPEAHFAYDGVNGPWVVRFQDLNNDGWADLAFLHGGNKGALHVHLNDGEGNVIGPAVYDQSDDQDCQSGKSGVSADMDLDGDADLVLTHISAGCTYQARVHENDGAGGWSLAAEISVAPAGEVYVELAVIGDLNGDRLPDLVVPYSRQDLTLPGALAVALNLGGMTFAPPVTYEFEDSWPYGVELADLDGDGDLDVAAWTRAPEPFDPNMPVDRFVNLFFNEGDGSLVEGQRIFLEQIPPDLAGMVESGDLDGDGDADLLATTTGKNDSPGRLWRLMNDGTGQFDIAQVIDVGQHPLPMLARDFDHDGVLEVALMFVHSNGLTWDKLEEPYLVIFENDGDGGLTVDQEFINPNVASGGVMRGADINADGSEDIVITGTQTGSARIMLNNGDGTFDTGTDYDGVSNHASATAIADFDGDGRTDIAITGGHYVRTLFNRACPVCPADLNADGALNILDFIAFQVAFLSGNQAADCDGDGRLTNPLDFICFQRQFLSGCP